MNLQWAKEGTRRVPSKIYICNQIYEQEIKNIFLGNTWNYVGLSSEVENFGDYIQTFVGNIPVILIRDRKGILRVFVNRCPHRGAKICHNPQGNTKLLVCPYHEWAFSLEGNLAGMPFRKGINGKGGMSEFFHPEEHGLQALNVTERHGVVFTSFSYDIEPFETYLDPVMLSYFDRVCDGRKLKVIGKMQHRVNCNWKLQIENVKDPFHAALLHSFFKNFGIWRSDQKTSVKVCSSGKSSVLVSTASFTKAEIKKNAETKTELSLLDPRIIDHQREYDHGTGAIMTVFPNLILLQQLNCLAMRHVIPDGTDSCIKIWTFFGYENESEALTKRRLFQANLLGPSGLVTIDDNEILAVTQEGAKSMPDSEIILEASVGESSEDHMMTEAAIRGFYKYYRGVMNLG
ncbi:aromatic ring-hydroxylating dioxygenase subunit alpha [Photorhabdus sp. RW14-46]|uniref:aromatic ring-hydroxylating dioxygenase subunit alpha n=1 Tax=Photorhabdus sp. RW14-46 TaxID=2100168 RepID=UPI0013F3AF70|nr:aromatic ring-hydroxylating dioxygenase subunit alpha [Photorhabdus sp. RW14-46]NHB61527.1 aromatic-ring-hydroxylating dioxygenase subunit alpha [Photorhabdus sp. RW14-46]